VATNRANIAEARRLVDAALERTARAFGRALGVRMRILTEKARLLSSDFAFKQAVATREAATVRSALENHRDRVDADVMMLVTMDGSLTVDTLHGSIHGGRCPLASPIAAAEASDTGEAHAIAVVDGRHYQLVVVPLFTPEPTAWIVIGFRIDDAFAEELREETGTHVTLLPWRPGAEAFASTLAPPLRAELVRDLPYASPPGRSLVVPLAGEEHVTWVVPVPGTAVSEAAVGSDAIVAVLQRSLPDALAPYLKLRDLLLQILGVGLGLSALGALLVASRVTRPVAALAAGARRIATGDYETPVTVRQRDELGVLADSFNEMMKGLSERDRVRDLLGKVVSPEVAEELLAHGLELGGEERCVSVLFSDVRSFTTISERKTPQELVHFLNAYLTRSSAVVERNGGVVDKYIGDAVMAIFGAPIGGADDAERAVRAGVEMVTTVRAMEEAPAIGIGINTGVVVAGNMGSRTRLNYTVIGDAVNLASRLEGLTKRYGVGVIASESTRDACPGWAFRELDRVRVKGKDHPVRIFEPIGPNDALRPEALARIARQEAALEHYRAGRLDEALRGFEAATGGDDPVLLALYRARIARLRQDGLPRDWDGTTDFDEK
ncbi:MAG TPA: adenylate/guanylate cyclase domain-containing protein, partial [Myxococcota bacterium]|nr:adenylate/guanylate cyclase domain-containing protein [Myxococcota bacterium]